MSYNQTKCFPVFVEEPALHDETLGPVDSTVENPLNIALVDKQRIRIPSGFHHRKDFDRERIKKIQEANFVVLHYSASARTYQYSKFNLIDFIICSCIFSIPVTFCGSHIML